MRLQKRRGVGERVPNLIMFIVLFNASAGAVNTLGLFSYGAQPNTGINIGNIQSQVQCQTYTLNSTAASCSPSIGNSASVIPSILIFGDWFGGIISFAAAFGLGFLIPGWFLLQFGTPPVWAGLFTLGIYSAYLMFGIWLRTGRPI